MPDKPSHSVRTYSPSLDVMIKEVVRTLGNFDFEHEIESEKVETSATADDLKRSTRQKLRAAHRERGPPYVDLLNRPGCSNAVSRSRPD